MIGQSSDDKESIEKEILQTKRKIQSINKTLYDIFLEKKLLGHRLSDLEYKQSMIVNDKG